MKVLAQRPKGSEKKKASHPKTIQQKEQRAKKVQDVVVVREASPEIELSPIIGPVERAYLLFHPKIHELAAKPRSGLPAVLQPVSTSFLFVFIVTAFIIVFTSNWLLVY